MTAYGAEAERVTAALHTEAQAGDTNVVIGAPESNGRLLLEDEPRYRIFNAAIGLGLANGLVTNTTWCLLVITCRYKTGCVG